MATRILPLPMDPDVGQLRRQARELQRSARAADPVALALLERHDPDRVVDAPRLPLSTAQLVLARMHGFAGWPGLVDHVDLIGTLRRSPDDVPAQDDPASEFLRLACLTYGREDSPARRHKAAALLAADPSLGTSSVYAAAATADPAALRAWLERDRAWAVTEGGPFGWAPLAYLAYARHDSHVTAAQVRDSVDLLLGAGGDPDTGYLWHGLPMPFTLLTGAFGEGERGPVDQPRHPRSLVLARRLLEAGADPNDGQSLYNRMFSPDDGHLELLLAFGLGRGDGGPWRHRFGHTLPSPSELLRVQLRWAVDHGLSGRVRLLAAYGVDVRQPFERPGYGEQAARHGDTTMVDVLVELGADRPVLAPVDALVAAVLRGDRSEVERLSEADPAVAASARATRPALVVQAAAAGSVPAVRLADQVGFDLDALGRADLAADQEWETALHAAVQGDHPDVVRALLELGADPTVRDRRFDSTPRGWAEHLGHPEIASLLPADPPER